VYQVGRGSDPMIDVGSITLAEPLNMRPSLILVAQICALPFHCPDAAREIKPGIGLLRVASCRPVWQSIAKNCRQR
jgi:hypothetical protein